VISGVIEFEITIHFQDTVIISSIRSSLLWICMIFSMLSIVGIILRYDLVMRWKRSTNQLTKYDNLINTGWWRRITAEIVI